MTWTSTQDIIDAERDNGILDLLLGVATGAMTSSTVNSGGVTCGIMANASGTTLWSTVKGFPVLSDIAPTRDVRVTSLRNASVREITNWLCRVYKIGTFDPTSTGQRLTHHSATFPVSRSGAPKPVRGFPLLLITTTLATPAFIISSIGYVNQDGVPVTGTKSFTAPATNAAIGTGMLFELEDDDCAIQDITAINVGTAGSAGACSVYLVEPILMVSQLLTGHTTEGDAIRGQRFVPPPLQPAVAAAGSAESELLLFFAGSGSTNTGVTMVKAVEQ